MARSLLNRLATLVVLDVVDHPGDFFQPDRSAVAIGHDDLAVVLGLGHRARRGQGDVLLTPDQRANRRIRIGSSKRRCARHPSKYCAGPRPPGRPARAPQISGCHRPAPAPRPASWEICCASTSCAYSSTFDSGIVCEIRLMNRIGKSPGLTFRNDGGVVISIGNRRCAIVSAVCTSRAAPSILRLRSNWMTIDVVPNADVERHRRDAGNRRHLAFDWTARPMPPSFPARARQCRRYLDRGKVDRRKRRQRIEADSQRSPKTISATVISVVITGRRIQASEIPMVQAPERDAGVAPPAIHR